MFGTRLIRLSLVALIALPLWPAAGKAEASGLPQDLSFTVHRDGDAIGTHDIGFSMKGNDLAVTIKTRVAVRLPLVQIAVYRFEHDGREIWRDGQLAKLTSKTDEDGTPHHLDVVRGEGHLTVDGDAGAHASPADIVPASLWNPRIIQGGTILNTLDGREMAVTVKDAGVEMVVARSETTLAHHYVLSGGLERELWYDNDWRLVQVRFKGSDGSAILYTLD